MTMTPCLRKFLLTAHITSSIGWLGAVVAYLSLAVAALTIADAQTVRAAWIAMELTGWFVIVPLAVASLLIGVVQSLSTPWGLFRHYWVLVKFLLTVFANILLLVHMPTVTYFARIVVESNGANLGGLGGELLHAGGGLLVLLVTTTLSVYKPRGMTPYGQRRREQRLPAPGPRGRRQLNKKGSDWIRRSCTSVGGPAYACEICILGHFQFVPDEI